MNHSTKNLLLLWTIVILLIITDLVKSLDITQTTFTNHKSDVETDSSSLKLEGRSEDDDLINLSSTIKPTNETWMHLDTSESRSNVRKIKSPLKDSYLNALEYSHSSNDPHEGVVKIDIQTKPSKVIRRTYEGPVYRPHSEYGPPKEPASSYGVPNNPDESMKIPRIVYGTPDVITPTPESFRPTPSNSYSLPAQQISNFNNQNPYGSGMKYGTPSQINYGTPSGTYGIPSSIYGPAPVPQKIYGPPQNNYLPAMHQPQQAYGPPQWSGFALPDLPQLPSLPSIDFLFPSALKLNAFTIAKIILKLVIFKMIVKFIAVLCLILFIPKLEMKKEENDNSGDDNDESRKLTTPHFTIEQLNNLTSVVLDSIDMYERANGIMFNDEEKCTSVGCRMRRFLQSGETWNDYLKLFNNYVDEEENVIPSLKEKSPTKIT